MDLSQNNLVRGSKRAEHASEDVDLDEFFGSSMDGIIKLFEALLTHPCVFRAPLLAPLANYSPSALLKITSLFIHIYL